MLYRYAFTYVTYYCAAAAQQGYRIRIRIYTLILHAAAAAAAAAGSPHPIHTLILHASIALHWALLCSIGYIAYTIIATAESRLRSGAGGRSLEQHEEGDAATLEGLGVGIV